MPGAAEWFLIFVVALIVFGPGKLPEIGRGMGKAIREFKKASREVTDQLTAALEEKAEKAPYSSKREFESNDDIVERL